MKRKNYDITAEVKQALADLGIVAKRPVFGTVDDWCALTGMSRMTAYRALSRGDLRAVKCGARTLVNIEAGLTWLQSLPPAKIRPTGKANLPN